MSNQGTNYILKLVDLVSAPLRKIASAGESVVHKLVDNMQLLDRSANRTAMSMSALRIKIEQLKGTRDGLVDEKQIRSANAEIGKMIRQLQRLENLPPNGFFSKLGSIGGILKNQILQYMTFTALLGVVPAIAQTTGEFEKMGAVLTNTLGNKGEAIKGLEMISAVAAKTPFSVKELTEGFIQLVNRGIKPTEKQIIGIGDVAATLGKPFDQLNQAILDVNNTERWTEIGIKAKTMGDKVSLTFRGVTQVVERTEKGVLGAVVAFGQMDGVAGTMATISNTITGKLSNINDKLDQVKVSAGVAGRGLIDGFMIASEGGLNFLLQGLDYINRNMGLVKDTVYALGLAAVGAAMGFYVYTAATNIAALSTISFTGIMRALNLAFLASPFFWIPALIAGFVFAIVQAYERVEWFRGGILGLWEAAKTVFTNIGNFFKQIFEPIFKAIEAFKKGDLIGAAKFTAQGVLNLNPVGMAVKAVKFASEGGFTKDVGANFNKGYKEGVAEIAAKKAAEKADGKKSLYDRLLQNITDPNRTAQPDKEGGGLMPNALGSKDKAAHVQGDSQKIVNLRIDKIEVNNKFLPGDGADNIMRMIREGAAELIVGAGRDAQLILAN